MELYFLGGATELKVRDLALDHTQQTILKKFCQNTCSKAAIKASFHFSHYESMQTQLS